MEIFFLKFIRNQSGDSDRLRAQIGSPMRVIHFHLYLGQIGCDISVDGGGAPVKTILLKIPFAVDRDPAGFSHKRQTAVIETERALNTVASD
jgi:hypothetical protein